MIKNKIRFLGLILSVVTLVTVLIACRYPSDDEYFGGGGTGGVGEGGTGGGGNNDNNVVDTRPWLRAQGHDVLAQLEWLRDYPNIRPSGYYYVVARAPQYEREIPGNSDLGSMRYTITVRIQSDTPDPANRRTIQLENVVGTMLNIGNGNTLYLQNINLQGRLINNTSPGVPLVRVNAGGTMQMTDSAISGQWGRGIGVFTNGRAYMNTGARVHGNRIGGVWVQGNNATLTMRNDAQVHSQIAGGGVAVQGGHLIMKDNSSLHSNAHWGATFNPGQLTMKDNSEIRGNGINPTFGRGIRVSHGIIRMKDDSRIHGNHDGGVHISSGSITMQDRARIHNNRAQWNGGGVFMEGNSWSIPTLTMYDNAQIHDNEALVHGGGAMIQGYGTISLRGNNVRIRNNEAGSFGGGIHLDSDNSTLNIAAGRIYGIDGGINANSADPATASDALSVATAFSQAKFGNYSGPDFTGTFIPEGSPLFSKDLSIIRSVP